MENLILEYLHHMNCSCLCDVIFVKERFGYVKMILETI